MAGPERLTMTVEEAAQVLGISRNSAFRAVRSGELPAVRIGRRLLIPLAQVTALLGAEPRERHRT
ncbi:MAG TPA: helix-turn-helix domain-containing protein [Mycobacteriales bacterium]|nr:helix-turn-helix domain-containing protein [Mycobacteriales bacterium]